MAEAMKPAGGAKAPSGLLDLSFVRPQFPALALTVSGRPAAFLDAPGGTQVPQRVIDAVTRYYVGENSNHGGAFLTSERTDAVAAEVHFAMADLLGCEADEVVFGPNMTTLTLALSRALGRELRPGDEIVVTTLDHEANVSPWRALEERGALIRVLDIDPTDCTLDMMQLDSLLSERTRIVAVGYASNAVGTINDVAEVVRRAHAVGALAFLDAVHYAPHGPIDVHALDCDFLACSVYKFFGPHAGVLYGKREHLSRLRPYKLRVVPEVLPFRWETGTQNHEAMAGTVAAVGYLEDLGRRVDPSATRRREAILAAYEGIRRYEAALARRLIEGLLQIRGLRFFGIADTARLGQRTPTVAVRIEGHPPRELARRLGERGIFTWDGNYYALSLTERLGVEASGGMLRIGLVHYNTADEVERLLAELNGIARG